MKLTPIKKNGDNSGEILDEEDMRLREKTNIEAALKRTDWKIYGTGGAAELLGIEPTTLLSSIKKWGLKNLLEINNESINAIQSRALAGGLCSCSFHGASL